ncbi:N-acetyltransferase [Lujinxingia litoralis]|uniref:N-acetyltransferase n=2 Tax=Lujinxingia litoralis TaxID=2211119 RepID=A0A328CB95_9DELT|nr:N-acetyltransferase [Lujinxingia litoralis]
MVRCLNPEDALLFQEAVDDNLEHLRPWLSWTRHEPRDLNEKIERLRQLRSAFDAGRDFVFGLFTPDQTRIIGACGLQTRQGPGAREVAYWVHRDFCRRGLATEVAAALVRVAFEVEGVGRVEIRCDPRNTPSACIPRKLGFEHEATLRGRKRDAQGNLCDEMIWTLFAEHYPGSQARERAVCAYDVLGRRLI